MIDIRLTATGVALAGLLIIGCRDAPTAPMELADSVAVPAFALDSSAELPPAKITYAYTQIGFYDGSHGGEPSAEISVGMRYIGNQASMTTNYSITANGVTRSDKIFNPQNALYDISYEKRFDKVYYIPTGTKCSLRIDADTQHQAWWQLWIRISPDPTSDREIKFTRGDTFTTDPCEPDPPPDGGGGGSGGWITIETCYYWAYYVNGVLIDIELRYCEYDTVPVADQ